MMTPEQDNKFKWPATVARKMAEIIHAEVRGMLTHSRLVRQTDGIMLLNRDEIRVGKMLGKGAFSEVHEVESEDGGRYAIKHLKHKLMGQPDNFRLAASELACEAHMLASFEHPNILSIRGWAANGIAAYENGCHDSFFLLLDRLDETLDQRIAKWQKAVPPAPTPKQNKSLIQNIFRRLSINNDEKLAATGKAMAHTPLYAEKLNICLQVAEALSYLHENGVIFRDLKPNNIGFLDGRVQLFDFGLSRELPSLKTDEYFEMSGKVGTLRYMATEVASHQPYNISADVYSWAMVTYEVVTLLKPFAGWTRDMHANLVCRKGVRPEIPPEVPGDLKTLLERCWSQQMWHRPSTPSLCAKVNHMIEALENPMVELPSDFQPTTSKDKIRNPSMVSGLTEPTSEGSYVSVS